MAALANSGHRGLEAAPTSDVSNWDFATVARHAGRHDKYVSSWADAEDRVALRVGTRLEQACLNALAGTQANAVREEFGRIDCFFNNAGIEGNVSSIVDYDELSDEDKDKDRSAVRNYIDIAVRAGLGFVELGA